MNETQVLYAAAKANMDTIKSERDRLASIDPSDDGIRSDYWTAFDALVKAEFKMIDWARRVIQNDPKFSARYGEVAAVFARPILNGRLRQELIGLCFRLDV